MSKSPLLEKALSIQRLHTGPKPEVPITRDEVNLVMAYFDGEITLRQYAAAIGMKNPGNISHRISVIMLRGIEAGWIKVTLL